MRTYRGARHKGRVVVTVEADGRTVPLSNVEARTYHPEIPDGWEWGYSGAGSAGLAFAILLDAFGDVARAEAVFQVFKWQFCYSWGDFWQIDTDEILAWYLTAQLRTPREGGAA